LLALVGDAWLAVPVILSLLMMLVIGWVMSLRQRAKSTPEALIDPDASRETEMRQPSKLSVGICAFVAMALILLVLWMTCFMLLANLNLHFSSTP
jgi:hypothetical protein